MPKRQIFICGNPLNGDFPSPPSPASACGWEIQLTGRAGMLLGPQFFQQLGDPAVDRTETVQPGVAGATEGDQFRGDVRGRAVVDDQRRGGLAAAA